MIARVTTCLAESSSSLRSGTLRSAIEYGLLFLQDCEFGVSGANFKLTRQYRSAKNSQCFIKLVRGKRRWQWTHYYAAAAASSAKNIYRQIRRERERHDSGEDDKCDACPLASEWVSLHLWCPPGGQTVYCLVDGRRVRVADGQTVF